MRKWTCLQAWKACYPVAKCLITTRLWVPGIGFAMHKSLGFDELGHKGLIGELPANRRTKEDCSIWYITVAVLLFVGKSPLYGDCMASIW